jgi:hypothetical protein
MKQWKQYDESCEFFGLMDAAEFDEEVDNGERWQGLWRNDEGLLEVGAEYVYDVVDGEAQDSGKGYWL